MKSRFVKFVGTMGLVMFPCFAQADVVSDILDKIDKIKNGVAQAEADVCDFFSQHDKTVKFLYDELTVAARDVALQVWVFVDGNCHQQDVKDAVQKP